MTAKQQTELERAIEIAKEHGHKVFTATHRLSGATVYTVRSHSDANLFHIIYIEAGRLHCDCYQSKNGHICSHAAAVRLFLIAQRDALASIEAHDEQQDEAERLASLPRTLANVKVSEETKLASLTMAQRAERAILQTNEPEEFSIYKTVAARHAEDAYGERADYVPGDYASHQYR